MAQGQPCPSKSPTPLHYRDTQVTLGARLFGVVCLITVLSQLSPAPLASADAGVSIDLGAVDITPRLSRGGTYQLPSIGVRNPGTERSHYIMTVSYLQDQVERRPTLGWFDFSPSSFDLEPGETMPVSVELKIPTGAHPDRYRAMIEARIATPGEGVVVGAGAAARLTFSVKPSNLLQAWQLRSLDWFESHAPWSSLLPAMVFVPIVCWWLSRRFAVSLSRRP